MENNDNPGEAEFRASDLVCHCISTLETALPLSDRMTRGRIRDVITTLRYIEESCLRGELRALIEGAGK